MYFNAIVVYITLRIIIDGRICIQISKLKPDIFLEILQINTRGVATTVMEILLSDNDCPPGQPLFLG